MPHRLDADAVPGAFGGLENGIFLLDFSIEGVLDLNEKKMRMVKADHYVDFPPGNIRLLAGFQSIFQKVGEDEAKIDLVDGKPGRQIDFGLEGNIFPLCQGGIVAEHTVHCLIFTEMKIRVGNFAGCVGKVFLDLFQIAVFCQGRQLKKMVADIVPCLTGFLNGGAEVIVAGLLERKKVIFLLKPCVSV